MPDRIKMYTVRVCFGGIKYAFVRFTVMEAEKQSEVPKPLDKSSVSTNGLFGPQNRRRTRLSYDYRWRQTPRAWILETVPNCELPNLLPPVGGPSYLIIGAPRDVKCHWLRSGPKDSGCLSPYTQIPRRRHQR